MSDTAKDGLRALFAAALCGISQLQWWISHFEHVSGNSHAWTWFLLGEALLPRGTDTINWLL